MMQSHETSRSRTSVDVPPIASTSNVEREEMKCQTELEQVLLELTREEAVLEATLSQVSAVFQLRGIDLAHERVKILNI